MDHMAECVMQNKTPYTPGEEGLQDQRIMEAIYLSAKTGKPVKLPLITTRDIEDLSRRKNAGGHATRRE